MLFFKAVFTLEFCTLSLPGSIPSNFWRSASTSLNGFFIWVSLPGPVFSLAPVFLYTIFFKLCCNPVSVPLNPSLAPAPTCPSGIAILYHCSKKPGSENLSWADLNSLSLNLKLPTRIVPF